MQKHLGWLWLLGFCGLIASADAQTSSPPIINTQYDGVYKFVSGTTINETWVMPGTERIFPCGYQGGGPLIVSHSQARYPTPARDFEGTVGPHGELTIQAASEPAPSVGRGPGSLRTISGAIDGRGTVRARLMNGRCNYDLIWQKALSTLSGNTQFDGRYKLVSLTEVNDNSGVCRRPVSLIVTVGEAWLPRFYGKVASGGELTMRAVGAGDDRTINGRIDGNGTVRAREIGRGCAYDFVWQKVNG